MFAYVSDMEAATVTEGYYSHSQGAAAGADHYVEDSIGSADKRAQVVLRNMNGACGYADAAFLVIVHKQDS